MLNFFRRNKSADSLKITKAGFIYIILTILLGVSATNTGNNLVYLIVASLLSFMALSGFLGRRNLKNLEIKIHTPEEIFADIKTPLSITVINKKRFFPSFLLRVYINDKNILFPYINSNSSETKQVFIKFKNRGLNKITNIEICSIFPFNFFIRCKRFPVDLELLVFPKPKKCKTILKSNNSKRSRKENFSNLKGFEGDLTGIRDYIEGDPLKLIHWKLSAKTDELKTKELSSTGYQSAIIDFDKLDGNLENKISCATYQILNYYKKHIPFGLKIGKDIYKPEYSKKQKFKLLKVLALYEKR